MDETNVSVGGTLRWVIEADTRQFDEGIDHAEQKAAELKSSLDKNFGAKDENLTGLKQDVTSVSDLLSGLAKSATSGAFNTLALSATTATTAIAALVRKGIQGTDFLETARVSMSGLTGSMEEGNKAMSIAANFWQNNPFDRFTTTKATQQLIQFGRTTNQLTGDLEILKQVALSTNTPLDELARFYARTAASGRAMTQDIEIMSDRGIPIYRELAKQLGTTEAGVREFASEGKISFEIFRDALEGAVNPEAMAQFEDTLARQRDRLSGSISILAGDLAGYKVINNELVISAQGLEKAYTNLLKTIATGLRNAKLRESLEKIGYIIADLVNKIADKLPPLFEALGNALAFVSDNSELLVPILGMALLVFGRLGSQLPVVGQFAQNFANSINNVSGIIKTLYKEHTALAIALTMLGIGFATAFKNSEDFRNAIKSLISSLGKLVQAILPALQQIVTVFVEIASSDAVVGVLTGLAQALAFVAKVVSDIPAEFFITVATGVALLALINVSPILGIAVSIGVVVKSLSELNKQLDVGKKFNEYVVEPLKKAGAFIASLPTQFATMGKNLMMGLLNGITSGASMVFSTIRQIAGRIVSTFASVLGIHSPSTVMAEQGKFITLGLANGITDSKSVIQKAMDNLASDILSLSSKVIENRKDFGLIDYNGEYKDWRKVASMFTEGSKQYQTAIEKMEAARKNANLQIIKLQEAYNDTLDSTIQKYQNMYSMFQSVNFDGGLSSSDILTNLDNQVSAMQGWAASLEKINELGLDPRLVEELKAMGVESADELAAIANMTSSELESLNSMWLQKQTIAENTAVKNLEGYKNETLNQIAQLKDGIDGETVNVREVGGRLVSDIGEGITGSIPTLESAFAQLDDYIADAARSMASSGASASADELGGLDAGDYGLDNTTQTIADETEKMKNEIMGAAGQLGTAIAGLISIGAGIKAVIAIIKSNKGKSIWEGIKGIFGFGKKAKEATKVATETADTMSNVAKETQKITKVSDTVGENLTAFNNKITKAQKILKTIAMGAVVVIAIAGAIAAMAAAMWVAYNLIPDDLGGMAAKLGVLALAIGGMAGISYVVGKFDSSIKEGLILIAGVAADIALVGLALGLANLAIPNDLLLIVGKLGVMGLAIAGMGALAIITTKFDWGTMADGLLLIAGIAVDLALVAAALWMVNTAIPDDLLLVVEKLGVMGLAIAGMGVLAVAIGRVAWDAFLGLALIAGVALDLALVGKALGQVDKAIKSDFGTMVGKLGVLGLAIAEMGVIAGILGAVMMTGIGTLLLGAGLVAILGICAGLVSVALAIGEIDKKVPSNIDKVKKKIAMIGEALQAMANASFGNIIGNWFKSQELSQLADMAKYYKEVAEVLEVVNKIPMSGTINSKIEAIRDALYNMSQINEDVGNLSNKEWIVGMSASIAYKMSEFVDATTRIGTVPNDIDKKLPQITDAINKISEIEIAEDVFNRLITVSSAAESAKKFPELAEALRNIGEVPSDLDSKLQAIRDAIVKISNVFNELDKDVSGKLFVNDKIIDATRGIVEKLNELTTTLNGMSDFDEGVAVGRIVALRNVVWEASQINGDVGDIGWKAWIVTATTSIIKNFKEMATALGEMGDVPSNSVQKVKDLTNIIWEATHIDGDVGDIENKEWIVGIASSIVWKMKEFMDAINNIGDTGGATEKIQAVANVIETLANSVKENLSSKMEDMYNQGVSLADKIREGLESKKDEIANVGTVLQTALWNAVEGKMDDEYQQGVAMATKFKGGLESLKGQLRSVGEAMQGDFWSGIESKMNDEYNQGRALAGKVIDGINSRKEDFENAGHNAIDGFVNAVNGHNLYKSGWDAAGTFLRGIKDRGEEGSPWKTTKQSGAWAIEGLIEGIQSMESDLVNEAEIVADAVVEAMTIDDATISPTISGTGRLVAPVMGIDDENNSYTNRRRVVIEQTNNNYTQYSVAQANRDLAWLLAKA